MRQDGSHYASMRGRQRHLRLKWLRHCEKGTTAAQNSSWLSTGCEGPLEEAGVGGNG